MKKRVVNLFIFFGLIYILAVAHLMAATHSLSKWESGKFDLVVSLGWIPTNDDKTKLQSVFELFAKDVYTMTEGHHSLNRLYVYTPDPKTNKARDWSKADIRFLNTADAANATIAGFKKAGRIFVDDDLSDLSEVGHALAHELGHYAYAVYDEYKDHQGPEPGFPHTNDTPKNSIMNEHWTWQNFSIPSDYKDPDERRTAHYRMYGESIWQTLISDTKYDPLWGLLEYKGYKNDRYVFPDLQALTSVPTLTKPTDNPALEIIYMEGSEVCIIIDKSESMGEDDKMASAISGAKSYLDKMELDKDYAAVVAFNGSAYTIGSLSLLDSVTKFNMKKSIGELTDGGGTSFYAALSAGYNILNASPRKGTYKYIVLLSDGNASVPDLSNLQAANIHVYAIGLGSGANMSALSTIASETGGKSYYAPTSSTLNAIYSDISSLSTDDKLNSRVKENLNLNKNSTYSNVYIDSSCKNAVFSSSFPILDNLEMDITMPNGTKIDSITVDSYSDIYYTKESGYIIYKVTNPAPGTWKIGLNAPDLTGESQVVIEAKTDSDYSISTVIDGGNYPDPILIVSTISKNYPIAGLGVSALITSPDSTSSTITMKDDGISPDTVAGDGQYSGIITSYIDGGYQIDITANNNNGSAYETSKGIILKKGTDAVSSPITENLTLMESALLNTSGVSTYVDNLTIANAIELTTDANPVTGAIFNQGDNVYYFFNTIAGSSYTIFTGGLYPQTMKTLVTLYDSPAMTNALASDYNSLNDTSAKIIYPAQETGVVYVSVKHESTGTGTFDIAVRSTQKTDSMDQPIDNSSSDKSDGEGCFINSIFK